MIAIILATVALVVPLSVPSASAALSRQLSVSGRQAWTDAGVKVNKGETIAFHASGSINVYSGRADYYKSPDGGPNCIASAATNSGQWTAMGLPCWSLVGRIGNGDPFFVGSASTFVAPSDGGLYLGVNDESMWSFNDNSGEWTVLVSTH
jgi:hypothetical protein